MDKLGANFGVKKSKDVVMYDSLVYIISICFS